MYEWIRLDTNEPFYVGKGHNDRWRHIKGRNSHFINIYNKVPCTVNILHDNLDEQIAYDIEVWYIREYRDIMGYDLCNINDGGEGQSLCGELNPMYGVRLTGDKNGFYGKHHTEKQKEIWSKKRKGIKHTEEWKEKISKIEQGKDNPNAKSVICLTNKKIFLTIKEAAEYCGLKRQYEIGCCCKGYRMKNGKKMKVRSAGKSKQGKPLVWRFLIWKHNKKYRIK